MKPDSLQRLKAGKLICSKACPGFVDTWNWLISFVSNLRGDYDINQKEGYITIDTSDDDHPIIRLRDNNLKIDGTAPTPAADNGCYAIRSIENDEGDLKINFKNPYFRVGGRTHTGAATVTIHNTESLSHWVLVLQIDGYRADAQASLINLDQDELDDYERADSKYIIPLYGFNKGELECDYRTIPQAVMWEFTS